VDRRRSRLRDPELARVWARFIARLASNVQRHQQYVARRRDTFPRAVACDFHRIERSRPLHHRHLSDGRNRACKSIDGGWGSFAASYASKFPDSIRFQIQNKYNTIGFYSNYYSYRWGLGVISTAHVHIVELDNANAMWIHRQRSLSGHQVQTEFTAKIEKYLLVDW